MPTKIFQYLGALVFVLLGMGAAFAQQADIVQAKLSQHVVVLKDGQEVLEPVEAVKPGDIIEYKVVYTNTGLVALRNVIADLPVPEGTTYQAKSTNPVRGALVSTANQQFAAEPLMRPNPDGVPQPVPLTEYRHIRWLINEIPAGAAVAVVARVQVNTNDQPLTQQPAN